MELPSSSSSPRPIRWRKGELIGAGAFGRVYMGMNLDSGELLAVKQVLIAANNVAKQKAQAHVKELQEEVKLLQNLSHSNIVRYLGTAREDDALNIFLEFVPGGSIASLLGKFGSFPESVIRMYARQLLEGLHYLHKHGIMHRDIKGANILVDNKGCIKLADFGASKQVVELVTLSGAKSMKGTPFWMAPEVIRQTGHSLPADIWSVGCTVIEMATGKPPWSQQFQEVAALFHIGTTKSHPPIPEHLSPEAQDFLLKCLKKEPHLRPTASELLEHPFTNPVAYPNSVFASSQMPYSMRASQFSESSKRQHLDVGDRIFPLQETQKSSPPKTSFNDSRGSFTSERDCSVRLDLNSFTTKSFKSGINFPDFDGVNWDHSIDNPVAEFTSFDPSSEPSYVDDGGDGHAVEQGILEKNFIQKDSSSDMNPQIVRNTIQGIPEDDCVFSFQCGYSDEDDEVTESRIKAFLDEKALELKKLQTPLYMEYHSIHNLAALTHPADEPSSFRSTALPKGLGSEDLNSPAVSPAARRQLAAPSSRSLSKASSTRSGPPVACRRDSDASVSSDSPGAHNRSVNFNPPVDSPRGDDLKGFLQEAQQPMSSPRNLSSVEQQRLWKEELQKELEMKREEKRMLSRLAGSSTKSSPVSKSASPKDPAQRHVLSKPSCASPIF